MNTKLKRLKNVTFTLSDNYKPFKVTPIYLYIIILILITTTLYFYRLSRKKRAKRVEIEEDFSHHILNNLQLTLSLIEKFRENQMNEALVEPLDNLGERLVNLSIIYEIYLRAEEPQCLSLGKYIEALGLYFHQEKESKTYISINHTLNQVYFNFDTLFPLGVMLFELFLNSITFAKRPLKPLEIAIDLQQEKDGFLLRFTDNGPGFPCPVSFRSEDRLGAYLF